MKFRRLIITAAMSLLGFTALPAQAGLLDFEFIATAGTGSTGDFGSGLIDLSGLGFTITGHTTSDADILAGSPINDGAGAFAVDISFDFGSFGTFSTSTAQTDVVYGQGCSSLTSISCAGILDQFQSSGFVAIIPSLPVSDADVPQPIGSNIVPLAMDTVGTLNLTNTTGHSLSLATLDLSVSEFSVTSRAVSEPAPLMLLLFGLTLLAANRRREKYSRID